MHNCAGIMVTTKKRQDFRIQLQKRARRRAEKKIEYLEDDKNWKDVSNASRASYSLLALIIPSSSIICLLRHAPLSCPMQRAAWKAFTEHFLMLFFWNSTDIEITQRFLQSEHTHSNAVKRRPPTVLRMWPSRVTTARLDC